MTNIPLISVLIPVYNGAEFITENLEKVYNQTYKNIEVLISIDQSTDNTEEICNKMKKDNVQIFVQKERLGWVKNCNFLIRRAQGKYFSIIPHDDYVPNNYFEKLASVLEENPKVSNCFPVLQCVGTIKEKWFQNNIKGSLKERIFDMIENHYAAISFRGLVRRDLPDDLLYLREDQHQDMMADTIWILQHAIAGEMICVNVPYYKRYHNKNEHQKWVYKSLDDKIKAWIYHCVTLYKLGEKYLKQNQRGKLYQLCTERLLYKKRNLGYIPVSRLTKKVVDQFDFEIGRKKVGVLGAGIQGCCTALLLHKYGYSVSLIDQASDIMMRASANQEGKIHMGFVYSNDQSFSTGKKMMIDALHFSHSMEYLLDKKINWNEMKSEKFIYLVPYDSLVNIGQLEEYFTKLENLYQKLLYKNPHLSYLDEKPEKIFHKKDVPADIDRSFFKHCFQTEEVALSQPILKQYIKEALEIKKIHLVFNTYITKVNHIDGEYEIVTDKETYKFHKVFNCLWEGQKKIDQCMNLESRREDNFRLKFGIMTKPIPELIEIPSITIVNGPYGDYVNFKCDDDQKMYFSWYPISMYGMVINQDIPDEWNQICKGEINKELSGKQIGLHQMKFIQLFKRKFLFNEPRLVGGVIVANGKEDINHKKSKLHQRNDIPIEHQDGYYSISTGKFTSGPHNAVLLKKIFDEKSS